MSRRSWAGGAFALAVLLSCSRVQAGTVGGVIALVDAEGQRVRLVQPGGREYVFACRDGTRVTVGGERCPLRDLRPGARAVVRYDDRDLSAVRIDAATGR